MAIDTSAVHSILHNCLNCPVLTLNAPAATTLSSKLSLMISRETQIRHWLQKKKDEYYTTATQLRSTAARAALQQQQQLTANKKRKTLTSSTTEDAPPHSSSPPPSSSNSASALKSRIAKLKEQLFLKTVSSNCQRNIVERIAEKGRGEENKGMRGGGR